LLTHLGARVEFLKEGQSRTPDIRAWWGTDPVDTEVRTAMVKERQTELRHIMETLRRVIGHGAPRGTPSFIWEKCPLPTPSQRLSTASLSSAPEIERGVMECGTFTQSHRSRTGHRRSRTPASASACMVGG
jgi:hypothetical protein